METAISLALAAAVLYGASDFLGGLLSRKVHYGLVGLVGQIAAATGGLTAALFFRSAPDASEVLWGMAAGLGGALGTLALYRGLAAGRMNVAGPLSAVGAAGLPIPVALLTGQRFTTLAVLGVALAIPGIWLVSRQPGARGSGRATEGVGEGLLAGVGFAGLFVCLGQAGDGAGLWPVAASQLTGAVVLVTIVLSGTVRGHRSGTRPGTWRRPPWTAIWPGVLGFSATLLYFLSARNGTTAISAVITSLYPAFTVVLAGLILRERTSLTHGAGLVLCAAAVGSFAVA
ncbi:DMT family transporter [Actinomadura viridis]|uniref:Drug/metabolite transporter (DMT)-like permease n=1 Tax=Actinomadura viridis TaxID=58110 RepID=A0A931GU36_9ACTN|nr:DMT family transporter [Actinomadura viridis]MBG6092734.1 drug/metabolite transporter (DMT)-like permease [Actinomadura viridis]